MAKPVKPTFDSEEKDVPCPICGTAARGAALKTHIRDKHGAELVQRTRVAGKKKAKLFITCAWHPAGCAYVARSHGNMDVHNNRHLMLKPYRCPHTSGGKEPNHVPEDPNPQCTYRSADPSALKKHREQEHDFKMLLAEASQNGTPREETPSDVGMTLEVQIPSSPELLSPDSFTSPNESIPGGAVRSSRSSSRSRFSPYPPSSPVETSSHQAPDHKVPSPSSAMLAISDPIVFPLSAPASLQPGPAAEGSVAITGHEPMAVGPRTAPPHLSNVPVHYEALGAQSHVMVGDAAAILGEPAAERPIPLAEPDVYESGGFADPASPLLGTLSYTQIVSALVPNPGANDPSSSGPELHASAPLPSAAPIPPAQPEYVEPGWSPTIIAEAERLDLYGPPSWAYFREHILPHL